MVGYKHFLLSSKYTRALFPKPYGYTCRRGQLQGGGFLLVKHFFPVRIEIFTSTLKPEHKKQKGLTLSLWNKIKEDEYEGDIHKESGFLQTKSILSNRRAPVAYIDVTDSTIATYYINWPSSTKHHRNKWHRELQEGTIYITEVSCDEFLQEYSQSDITDWLKDFYSTQAKEMKQQYVGDMHFYFVHHFQKVVAGVCIIDDTETRQIIYQYVFVTKQKEYKHIGVGIIDFCIQKTFEKGYRYLGLTAIYEKGQPKSWLGLTKFKNQFHPKVCHCRNTYFRLDMRL